ncbi:MAG TPA: EAL domain-containing protein [Longimicrobiaceae bacterium]|nr:EAL domain-containing protein [Longimicrobiaceae bacterium]
MGRIPFGGGPPGSVPDAEGRRESTLALLESAAAVVRDGVVDSLLESAAVGIAACDRELRFTHWNRFLAELTGLASPEVVGRGVLEVFPRLVPAGLEALRRALAGEAAVAHDTEYALPRTGRRGWVSAQYLPLRGADGEVAGVVGVVADVTERKRAEEESRRLAAFSRENPNPVLECDRAGRVTYANPATGHHLAEVGCELEGFLPAGHDHLVRTALATGQVLRTIEVVVDDRIFSWTYHPHPPLGVVHLFADDITARRAVEEQLRHDALHDALTGLPNRYLFMERLARSVLHEKRRERYLFAVLFLDLDRFKVVNDGLGHHVGDELLIAVAARLRGCVRETDTVARFGGDEFAVLLDDIGSVEVALRAAERLQHELTAPVALSGYEVFTSASIGIALSSEAYGRPEYLLRNADMAMYRAKGAGGARYEIFDRAMHALALTRLQMETDLRRGVDRGEFTLHYQPIVSLRTGRIAGAEALLRWQHPERGWIAPVDFVSTAEETGLILLLGRGVIRHACEQLQAWRRTAPRAVGMHVSVNLSVKQFSQADLVEQVRGALADTGEDPRLLRLEVTESVIVENVEAAASTLGRLKALGVQVYMDDFGTGYSSLSSLHRLPLDALKVDRSFVARLGVEPEAAQLVRTVATLAHNLELAVIAEGVETAAQLEELRALGCEFAQGFFFSPPLDPERMRALLEEDPCW